MNANPTWANEADCENGCRPISGTRCCPTCDQPDDWYERIACAPHANDIFFGGAASDRVALRICATCPVRPYCLEKGWNEEHGVWGGMTESQRRAAHAIIPEFKLSRRDLRRAIRELGARPVTTN